MGESCCKDKDACTQCVYLDQREHDGKMRTESERERVGERRRELEIGRVGVEHTVCRIRITNAPLVESCPCDLCEQLPR